MPVFVMPVSVRPLFAAWLAALFLAVASPAMAQTRSGAVAILKKPALPADFAYFPYVNPDAPKGGEAVLGAVGTFDSFNPFILRGSPATHISHTQTTLLPDTAQDTN